MTARRSATAAQVVPIRPDLPARKTPAPRRGFGSLKKQRSGRWQASYLAGEVRYVGPVTFLTRSDAEAWLSLKQAEIIEHRWKPAPPPEARSITFTDYAAEWLAGRELGPKTRTEYQRMVNDRLAYFGPHTLDAITPAMVKGWWDAQGTDGHRTARRRAYDVLHAILATASRQDEDTDAPPIITANPARLSARTKRSKPAPATSRKGATVTTRRPRVGAATVATPAQIDAIADAMPPRYRAMVQLATWCAPRFGELTELRRSDVALTVTSDGEPVSGVIHISRAVSWPDASTPVVKEPKSEAGVRSVAIPPHILRMVQTHLAEHAAPGPDGLLFPAVASGGHMKHGALYKVYRRARLAAGRPDLRWHDLRHTGATYAAHAGATLGDLMARLGHSTVAAALIYQGTSADRDAEIARKLSALAQEGR